MTGASCSTASTCATWPGASSPARSRSSRRRRSSSTTRSAATSRSVRRLRRGRLGGAARRAGRRLRRRAARRAGHPAGRARDVACPAVSGSGSRLARALVRRPRLLILDDATSAVDPEVEARILEALRDRRRPAPTLVVVAYRKATIGLADEVVHLEDGRIADRGRHAELLARNPSYANLVNAYEQQAEVDAR